MYLSNSCLKKQAEEQLLLPFKYIQKIPGKQVRGKLALALNYWMKIPSDKLAAIGLIVQKLHNISVLIDDIQDNSTLRRGVPVAHAVYGVPSTLNAAYCVCFEILHQVHDLGHPDAVKVYTEQLLELHRGQGMEINWRDNFTCPSEDEYKVMAIRKTGGLFMLAVRLMQLFSENKSDFTHLIEILGLYFQIRDDYCNLSSHEYSQIKSYCEDLTEGKFSFPIIHGVQSESGKQILNILKQRCRNVKQKQYCVSLLEKSGSFLYTRQVLASLDKQARTEVKNGLNAYLKFEIQRLGGNSMLEAVLDSLLNWRDSEDNK